MTARYLALLLAIITVCSVGCGRDSNSPTSAGADAAAVAATARDIHWYEGSPESAFAAAKQQGKPVFAYWGAEWCPYCNELQATVFIREEFVRLSHRFVAVDMSYRDSESIRSGDKYKILGFPTVIVFDSEGTEITRIAGGADVEQYAAVLEMTLDAIRPVSRLVTAARAGETLTADDWFLLSTYSWRDDRSGALGDEPASEVLPDLYERCPSEQPVVCSRLGIAALGAWLEADEESRDDRAGQYTAMVEAVLADPDLSQANLYALADSGADILDVVDPQQQETVQAGLLALYAQAIEDPATNLLNKTTYLNGWVKIARKLLPDDGELPAEQVAWARQQADAALSALNPYQVQSGINNLWVTYYRLGLNDRARKALDYGIANSKAPYYFMSGMAYLEQEEGDIEAALDWRRRAWEATRQPLHKISWGRGYLRRLMTQAPDNSAEIERVGSAVIGDILAFDGGVELYAKTLDGLDNGFTEWSGSDPDRRKVVADLRQQVDAACKQLPESEAVSTFCREFLPAANLTGELPRNNATPG